jgi:very-short-patch-repair endonuclease
MAVCLWAGEDAVASHRAAAVLWGLDGFVEGPLEITGGKKNQSKARFRVHQPPVPPNLVTGKNGIPVTNAARTLFDLAACTGEERMSRTLDEALRKGIASLEVLRRMVDDEDAQGRRGMRMLRRLLDERSPDYQPSASELQRLVRNTLIAGGFTNFVEEYVIVDEEGNFVARGDFAFLDLPVIVEAEGRANHSSKLDWEHDLDRRNRLTALGWAIIHVTWSKVRNHREEFLNEVRRVRASQARRRK